MDTGSKCTCHCCGESYVRTEVHTCGGVVTGDLTRRDEAGITFLGPTSLAGLASDRTINVGRAGGLSIYDGVGSAVVTTPERLNSAGFYATQLEERGITFLGSTSLTGLASDGTINVGRAGGLSIYDGVGSAVVTTSERLDSAGFYATQPEERGITFLGSTSLAGLASDRTINVGTTAGLAIYDGVASRAALAVTRSDAPMAPEALLALLGHREFEASVVRVVRPMMVAMRAETGVETERLIEALGERLEADAELRSAIENTAQLLGPFGAAVVAAAAWANVLTGKH